MTFFDIYGVGLCVVVVDLIVDGLYGVGVFDGELCVVELHVEGLCVVVVVVVVG